MISLLGARDELLRLIERSFDVDIVVRGQEVRVSGPAEETARVGRLLDELLALLDAGQTLDEANVAAAIRMVQRAEHQRPAEVIGDEVLTHRGRSVRPRSPGQKVYLDAIRTKDLTFAIGPAGTGKTYLAMAAAVRALEAGEVNRLILTRPAVEAGERLGFLPGTLSEKVDPYLRPLFDALHDMMDADEIATRAEQGTIEVAPLAYMRGRTLNSSFVVLDEAQNATVEQMKMFLTRMGFGSRTVVTGDITQVDLPKGRPSGLKVVRDVLEGVEGVAFCWLSGRDVVRHEMVQRIVEAWARYDDRRAGADGRGPGDGGVDPADRPGRGRAGGDG